MTGRKAGDRMRAILEEERKKEQGRKGRARGTTTALVPRSGGGGLLGRVSRVLRGGKGGLTSDLERMGFDKSSRDVVDSAASLVRQVRGTGAIRMRGVKVVGTEVKAGRFKGPASFPDMGAEMGLGSEAEIIYWRAGEADIGEVQW